MFDHDIKRCLPLSLACSSSAVQAVEQSRAIVSPLVTLGKLAIALLVVLAVFYVFARVMRQLQGSQAGAHNSLKCIGSLSLGQRERVVVVQAGEKQLVLGVTASQVNTLHVLDTPLVSPSPTEAGDFRQKLSAALQRQVRG